MPNLRKVVQALKAAVRSPRGLARDVARLPLEREAAARIAALPTIELADLVESVSEVAVRLAPSATRHGWSLGSAEQLIVQVLIRGRRCRTAFEIGTFNGGTTRVIAEALPSGGNVWTIDLPATRFAATQQPPGFDATDVGVAYRGSPAAEKITQLFGDSLDYDFDPYVGSADLVLVDAGHEYPNGFADTKTALRIVSERGLILWDDFTPYWYGLVNGICDAMEGRSFGTLAGTALAVYVREGDR